MSRKKCGFCGWAVAGHATFCSELCEEDSKRARLLPAPAPAAKPKSRKRATTNDRPAGWSEGAWAYQQAAERANTYASAHPEKIHAAAMRACEKNEEIRDPINFSATLYHPDAPLRSVWGLLYDSKHKTRDRDARESAVSVASVALGKLGAHTFHLESAEEAAAYTRTLEYRDQRAEMRRLFAAEGPATTPLYHIARDRVDTARKLARQLLAHGQRAKAVDLAREIRAAERRMPRAVHSSI